MADSAQFKLGFCPTMADMAVDLKGNNEFVQLYPFGSAAEALFYLKQKAVNAIVIGRLAKERERSAQMEMHPLQKEGYTLVCHQKGFIEFDHIGKLRVHTYLPQELVQENFPELKQVSYYADKHSALQNLSDTEVVLIDWRDFEEDFELMIPVNESGKIKKYRLPVLYYLKENASQVRQLLGARE